MKIEIEIIEENGIYSLKKILGKVQFSKNRSKLIPFEAFLFEIEKDKSHLKLIHTGKHEKLSCFVKDYQYIAAINGGFWNRDKEPLDWFIFNNKIITNLSNTTRPYIFIDDEDSSIKLTRDDQIPANLLQSGPLLIKDYKIKTDYSDYSDNAKDFDSDITADRHPRTIFGYCDKKYYFLTINGRSIKSAGLYLEETAELCQILKFKDAINLDGGASSTLIVKGKIINEPRFSLIKTSRYISARVPGRERKISNALILSLKK